MKTAYEREGFDLVMERYLGISNQPHAELVVREGSVVFYRDGYMRIFTPKKVAWDGSGVPPVGTVCERRTKYDDDGRYEQVRIIAHTSKGFPVWENTDALFAGIAKENMFSAGVPAFRPIRTPEQIAEELRVKACQEWLKKIEEEYGRETADKCEDILMEAERRNQARP